MIAQLSDLHLAPPDEGRAARTRAAVEAVAALPAPLAALLLSGDLADVAGPDAYAQARELVAPLELPVHAIAGNHDDRARLREAFPGETGPEQRTRAVAHGGPLRLVAIDSTVPGAEGGRLDRDELDWLDTTLAGDAETPTVVALHHPPVASGFRALDRIGIAPEECAALGEVIARHAQVQVIACGHQHRTAVSALAGVPVVLAPSVNSAARLDLRDRDDLEFTESREPLGFVVHALVDGRVVSHVQALAPAVA